MTRKPAQAGPVRSKSSKQRKTSKKPSTHVTMKDMEAVARQAGLELTDNTENKRIYRKAASDELTDPTRSPRAEVNRLTKSTGLRLSEDDIKRIEEIAQKYNLTRTQWIAKVVMVEVEREENNPTNQPDIDP